MKTSSCSGSSLRSDQSNILTLSSNKSDSPQVKRSSQLQTLKIKLSKLFQVDSNNVEDLYLAIQHKYSKKFVHQTFDELNDLVSSLGKIKKNNREMAKLVSSLGIKLKGQQNNIKHENRPTAVTEQSKNLQTNQSSTSYEEYHFEYHPVRPTFGPQNPQFHPTSSYKQFQTQNKKYEQKIIQMLNELGNIKTQIKSKRSTQLKPATNKINCLENQPQVIQSTSQQSELPKFIHHKPPSQSYEAQRSLLLNGQNQKSIYMKASEISKRLQEIKTKIQGIKTEQENQLIQNTCHNENNPTVLKQNRKICHSKQKSVKFQSQSNSLQLNHFSMDLVDQNTLPVFDRHTKKKSLLDDMKNVQSKMIISENQICDKDTLIDVFKGAKFHGIETEKQKNQSRKDQISSKLPAQILMQKSNIKQVVISYSNMSHSNLIGANSKNLSYHNTSIMNPHYMNRDKHSEHPPVQQRQHPFEKNSFSFTPRIINFNKNNSHERLDNRNYSRQKFVPSQPNLPFIQEVRPVERVGHSQSANNISMKNLNNRLENPMWQGSSSQYINLQRHPHPKIPFQMQYLNLPFTSQGSQTRPERKVNPFENLNQEMQERKSCQKTNGFYNMSRNSSFYEQSQDKSYQTSGINLSVMKRSPDSQFVVTLGKPTGCMRESRYSRDSKDSKKGKGVKLSNEFL